MTFADYLTHGLAGGICTASGIVGFTGLLIGLQTDPPRRLYLVGASLVCILSGASLAHTYFGV